MSLFSRLPLLPLMSLLTHDSTTRTAPGAECVTFDLLSLVGHRIDEIGQLVADSYRDKARIRRAIADANDGTGFDVTISAEERAALRAAARVPRPGRAARPQWEVPRSELAEILIRYCLSNHHGAVFPAKRLRHKERVDSPMRGIDDVGLVRDTDSAALSAVLVEAKASTEDASPPAVVATGSDSICNQLHERLADEEQIYEALTWAEEHAEPEHQALALEALAAYENGTLALIASPGLLREAHRSTPSDFTPYASNDVHTGHRVVFNLVRLEGDLRLSVHDVYFAARRLAQ
jgi:hypothetical protein